jgi:hypothetical protein
VRIRGARTCVCRAACVWLTESIPQSRSQNESQFIRGQSVHPTTADPIDLIGTANSIHPGRGGGVAPRAASSSDGRQ